MRPSVAVEGVDEPTRPVRSRARRRPPVVSGDVDGKIWYAAPVITRRRYSSRIRRERLDAGRITRRDRSGQRSRSPQTGQLGDLEVHWSPSGPVIAWTIAILPQRGRPHLLRQSAMAALVGGVDAQPVTHRTRLRLVVRAVRWSTRSWLKPRRRSGSAVSTTGAAGSAAARRPGPSCGRRRRCDRVTTAAAGSPALWELAAHDPRMMPPGALERARRSFRAAGQVRRWRRGRGRTSRPVPAAHRYPGKPPAGATESYPRHRQRGCHDRTRSSAPRPVRRSSPGCVRGLSRRAIGNNARHWSSEMDLRRPGRSSRRARPASHYQGTSHRPAARPGSLAKRGGQRTGENNTAATTTTATHPADARRELGLTT